MDVDWLRSSSFIYLSVRRALCYNTKKWTLSDFFMDVITEMEDINFCWRLCIFQRDSTVKILYKKYYTHTHTQLTLLGTVVILDNILWLLIMQNQVNFFLEQCVFPFLVISITAVYDLLCFHRPWDYLMTWCMS